MRWCCMTCGLALLALAGCQSGETSAPSKVPQATAAKGETKDSPKRAAAKTDDVQAVEALGGLTKGLKRDGEGCVTEVDFRGAAIDDGALAHLSGLRRVRSVTLAETGVTDAAVATLGSIATLQALDLRECKLTNAGIAHLAGLTNLRILRLSGKNGGT